MTHFRPRDEREHRLGNAGHGVSDYCANCGHLRETLTMDDDWLNGFIDGAIWFGPWQVSAVILAVSLTLWACGIIHL